MKIQITIDQPEREGYLHASPMNPNMGDKFLELHNVAHSCQVSEIYAPEILDALSFKDVEQYLRNWVDLLEPNGKILVGGTDVYILAKAALSRNLSIDNINTLLFDKPFFTRSITSIEYIKNLFLRMGLSITDIALDYSVASYIVEAKKLNV